MDLFSAIADERRGLAELFAGLIPEQQNTQSLCSAWTVRQVVGHLVMPMEVGMPRVVLSVLRHGGSFDKANDSIARQLAKRPYEELVAILRDKADSRFMPPGQGPDAPLTDVLVHGLDITRPLGIERGLSADLVKVALDYLVSPAGKGLIKHSGLHDVRLEASDLDWAHGDGPAVRGTGQALLLALTGRSAGRQELSGAVPTQP